MIRKIASFVFNPLSFTKKDKKEADLDVFANLTSAEKSQEKCLEIFKKIKDDRDLFESFFKTVPTHVKQESSFWETLLPLNSETMSYMPHDLVNREFVEQSLKYDYLALFLFKDSIDFDEDLILKALDHNTGNPLVLMRALDQALLTDAVIDKAIGKSGFAIYFIPEKRRTKERCELAFKDKKFNMLSLIPQEHITFEMCKKTLSSIGHYVRYVPEHILSDEKQKKQLYDLAAKSGCGLRYLPVEERTYERCFIAICRRPQNLEYVPLNHKTDELMVAAVGRDENVLNFCTPIFIEMYHEHAYSYEVERVRKDLKLREQRAKIYRFITAPLREIKN